MRIKSFANILATRVFIIIIWLIMATNANILICEAELGLAPVQVSVGTEVGGIISEDTTWSEEHYVAKAHILVPEGVTLTIEHTKVDINASYNWWGTTDTAIIEDNIYDFNEDFRLGKVIYQPILSNPISNFEIELEPKPAKFEVSGLEVHPLQVEVEKETDVWTFTISVDVKNIGEEEGSHTVDLKVDGLVVDSETVTLAGGEKATILYKVTRGIGSYMVEVDGLTGSFGVTLIYEPSFWDKIPGFPYESIIIGLISVIIILWYGRVSLKR